MLATAGCLIACGDAGEPPGIPTQPSQSPPTQGPVLGLAPLRRAVVGGESRLVLPAAASSHRIRVEPGGVLRLSIGLTADATQKVGPVRFQAGFNLDGATAGRTLLNVTLRPGHRRWHDYTFPFGGERARGGDLVLTATGKRPVNGIAVWGVPRVDGPRSADADGRPDIVLISVDTLRADHLGAWGHARATSPAFDQLAADGVRFANAVAPASWTLPSHATMLTGLDPATHGSVAFRESTRLGDDVSTLAETLWSSGYQTAGVVGGGWLSGWHGFDRGFETYVASQDMYVFPGRLERSLRTARNWLSQHRGGSPFFLFVHTYQAHMPFTPPRPYSRMFDEGTPGLQRRTLTFEELDMIGLDVIRHPLVLPQVEKLYDAEIRQVDDLVGAFVAGLKRFDRKRDLCVVIASDHGEAFGEHDQLFHDSADLGQALVHVPLLIWCSGSRAVAAGRVVTVPVGVVDIAPTILDLAGHGEVSGLDGRSLVPWLAPGDSAPEGFDARVLVSDVDLSVESRRAGDPSTGDFVIALRRGSHKLVYRSALDSRELFDLASDPAEMRDLASSRPELLASFDEALSAAIDRRRALPLPTDTGVPALPSAGVEQLRALGYFE